MKTMVLLAAFVSTLYAQDIAGDWQGMLKVGAQDLRVVLRIEKSDNGVWKATSYSLDQSPEGIPASSMTVQGSSLKVVSDALQGVYEGKFNADWTSISGTWTQGAPMPLEFHRATKETAWQKSDSSPHTVQFITVDNDVTLEVLDWAAPGGPWSF
jgi:hypothetical protein